MLGGLFNSSSKTKNTQNTSNTNITQDMSDNSSRTNDGQYAGASFAGDVNIVDGGAFGVVDKALFEMGSLGNAAFNTVNTVADSAFLLADGVTGKALSGMESTAYEAIDRTSWLANNAVLSGNDLARDLAAENSLLARESVQFGGELYRDLLTTTAQLSGEKDNFALDTTRYALQFADNASRSDGQQLAIAQGKNMMWIFLGLAAVGVAWALRK